MKLIYRNKVSFILLLSFLFILVGSNVQASTTSISERKTVERDKVWIIKFNQPIDYNDIAVGAITVVDSQGEKVNIGLEVTKDKKAVMVKPPVRMYTEGEEYTLKVERNIYSGSGARLKDRKEIKFTINKNEPYEDYQRINPGDIVISGEGKNYITYDMLKLSGIDGSSSRENGWAFNAYRTVNSSETRGLLFTLGNSNSLSLPFKVKGWMGLYVGYHSDTEEFMLSYNGKEYKFKNYNYKVNSSGSGYINETFVFANNFNENNNITLSPISGKKARIAYVKLVSLKDEEVALYNKINDTSDGNKKSVVYDNDGYTDFFLGRYPDVQSLIKFPQNLSSKLQGEINWTMGTTGLLTYNSAYAGPAFLGAEKFDPYVREGDKLARQQILNILSSGKSPLEIVGSSGKALGVNVNASMRMNTFYSEQSTKFLNGLMYDYFSESLQNGSQRLSYYYPNFRNYILNVLKEISAFENVDGITLDFCRYPYVMGNEATLKEKVDIMNEFMRKVRNEIPGKKITVRFPYLNPFSYGLDIDTWVKEGLIDRAVPSVIGYEDFWKVKDYITTYKTNKVQVLVGISANLKGRDLTPETEKLVKEGQYIPDNRYLSAEEYLIRAYEAYNSGADGIFIFNILNDLDVKGDVSPKFKLLGDKFGVEKWYKFEYEAYLVNHKVQWMF